MIELLRLSKPYPFIKAVKDGKDFVFSFLSFYIRFVRIWDDDKMKGLKLLLLVLRFKDGLTYLKISKLSKYHLHTISKTATYLEKKGLIVIAQIRNFRQVGRQWNNVIYPSKRLEKYNKKQIIELIYKLAMDGRKWLKLMKIFIMRIIHL